MFGIKKAIKALDSQLRKEFNEDLRRGSEIITRHSEKLARLDGYVECSTCGVLVNRDKAKKVQALVDIVNRSRTDCYGLHAFYEMLNAVVNKQLGTEPDKEIKTDYYCIHCKPKNKKK